MARNHISSVAFGQVNSAVRTLPGASVLVTNSEGATVPLYPAKTGVETVANPFRADDLGRYEFFVEASEAAYTVTVTLGPVSYFWEYNPPDNTAAAGLIYEATWSDLVGTVANQDGAAAEVTNDSGTHEDATATGYDGGEVDNLGRYRWNEGWQRWVRIADQIAPVRGQPFQTVNELEAAEIPGSIYAVGVLGSNGELDTYIRSNEEAGVQSADGAWWVLASPSEGAVRNFTSRAAAVSALDAGFLLPDGYSFSAGGVVYTFDSTAGDPIADMPGVVEGVLPPTNRASAITLTVGSGGDFATLSAALEHASRYQPTYRKDGTALAVNILTGTTISEQVVVDGVNLSWISITSVDAIVTIDRSALTTAYESRYPFIHVRNGGTTPRIECLFQMDASGSNGARDGIYAISGGNVIVGSGAGINNAGGEGLHGNGAGFANVVGAEFQNGGTGEAGNTGRGIWWRFSGKLNGDGAVTDGANWTGFQVQSSPFSAVGATANNCGHYGFRARGGCGGSARSFYADGCAGHGCNVNEAGHVELTDSTFTNCGVTDGEPAVLIESSWADLGGATISGQYNGVIECRSGVVANAPASINADVNGTTPTNTELRATRGGQFLGAGFAAFSANIPFNTPTARGQILDQDSEIQAAVIAGGAITLTHTVASIADDGAGGTSVSTINFPDETPDGTVITLYAASTSIPIDIVGDLSGNIFLHNNATVTLDNADANTNFSMQFVKRTAGGFERWYECGWHQR